MSKCKVCEKNGATIRVRRIGGDGASADMHERCFTDTAKAEGALRLMRGGKLAAGKAMAVELNEEQNSLMAGVIERCRYLELD